MYAKQESVQTLCTKSSEVKERTRLQENYSKRHNKMEKSNQHMEVRESTRKEDEYRHMVKRKRRWEKMDKYLETKNTYILSHNDTRKWQTVTKWKRVNWQKKQCKNRKTDAIYTVFIRPHQGSTWRLKEEMWRQKKKNALSAKLPEWAIQLISSFTFSEINFLCMPRIQKVLEILHPKRPHLQFLTPFKYPALNTLLYAV